MLSWAARYEPPPPKDRCDGSGQLTLASGRARCPVCDQLVNTETTDGRAVLVEHRPTARGAQPVTIGLGL